MVKMHGLIGAFPNDDFKALSEEEQRIFFEKASHMSSAQGIATMLEEHLHRYAVHEFSWAMGGEYLPLSAWAVKGFDTALIEANTSEQDISISPQMGVCYRVKILTTKEMGREGTKRSMTLSAGPANPSKQPRLEDVREPLPIMPAAESTQQFLARQKIEKESRKTLDKANVEKKSAAMILAKKLAGPLKNLGDALDNPRSKELNPAIVQAAVACRMGAERTNAEILACIEDPAGSTFDCIGGKVVVLEMCKDMGIKAGHLNQVIAMIARMM
jgi:hypothetical protein